MVLKFLYHGYCQSYSSVLLLSQYHYIDSTLHSPVQALLLPLAAECILGTVRLSNHLGISPRSSDSEAVFEAVVLTPVPLPLITWTVGGAVSIPASWTG